MAVMLGPRIRTASPVAAISRNDKLYTLHMADGTDEESDVLILAVPAFVQAGILQEYEPELAGLLSGIGYPALSVVCLGYREDRALPRTWTASVFWCPPGSSGPFSAPS